MAWIPHSDWFERMMDGTDALDLDDAVGGAVIKLGIVSDATVNPDSNPLFSGLTAVGTATGWTGPVTLASKTCGLDGSNDVVFDAADIAQIAQDASGFTNGRWLIIYASVNSYILASHDHGSSFGNVAGPITITFDSGGIVKWTI